MLCASCEMDITTEAEGVGSSVSPVTGEAWRESMDSGALRPPRLGRGSCGLSNSSLGERSCSKDLAGIRGGGPELERHGRNDIGSDGETGLLLRAPLSNHGGIEETATS